MPNAAVFATTMHSSTDHPCPILHTAHDTMCGAIAFDMAACLLQGSGSQLGQLRKEELRLTDKLAEQQSKTAQAEAAATLMQISADLTHKVSHTCFCLMHCLFVIPS